MQKGQNAIKIIIFIFCIKLGYAQTNISGTYNIPNYTVDGGEYTKITFLKNGTFKKEISGEFGTYYYGNGDYSFINDKLILNFNKTEPQRTGYHFSKIWMNKLDYIKVNFHFFDFDNIPLPYVNVIYQDTLSKNGFSGVAANEKGLAVVNLKRDRTKIQFKISNLAFNQYELTIDKNYNYDISVFLQKEGHGLPILDQIDTLEIVKNKPKYFTVKNKNGSISTWKKSVD